MKVRYTMRTIRELKADMNYVRMALNAIEKNGFLDREFTASELGEKWYVASHNSQLMMMLTRRGIAEIVGARPKVLQFSRSGKDLWEHARAMFRSPVKRTLLNRLIPQGVDAAGLSALAERTLMAAPVRKVFAVDERQAGDQRVCSVADSRDDAQSELQIWHYPPRITGSGKVDRYSLFLSLKDAADPRIEGALEDMMEDA